MKTDYSKFILQKLKKAGNKPITFKELNKSCRQSMIGMKFDFDKFISAVDKLKADGEITESRAGITILDESKLTECEIVKLNKTYGFARNVDTLEEYFVPGKFLKGAMPHDIVLADICESDRGGDSKEAHIVKIKEENFSKFTGELVNEFGKLKVVPDMLSKYALDFKNPLMLELHEGDKVVAEITKRGSRHSEHKCEVTACCGSSLQAASCALSILEVNGLTPMFPSSVIFEAKNVSDYSRIAAEIPSRLDLRDKPIFTIDSASTKDIDDAVSVEKTENGYRLGVHIADVSHYVKPGSELDKEAFHRGTSVYYADRVIPMLPPELSNGICSLNPNEDRLAFSCIADLDKQGNIVDYKFAKTVIRSRVKGVYSEINQLLEGNHTDELDEKYKEVIDCFPAMTELEAILSKKKIDRGSPQLETVESYLIIDENGVCVDVKPRERGRSEELIEDFMLIANECAAKFGSENKLPFVYRVHEPPTDEKVEGLKESLVQLNVLYKFGVEIQPGDMAAILEKTKGTKIDKIMNNVVLRSMSKAKYSTEPLGHFGLVLKDYAHFTSPIRRYPDLTIHRIMSDFLESNNAQNCRDKFTEFAADSAEQSTKTEITAMQVERNCEDCYKAEFMHDKIGEVYVGTITSALDFGLFVALDNTCEGLLHVDNISEGEWTSDGVTYLKNLTNGEEYRVGDKITVKVENTNVNSGKIDFTLA